MNIFHTYMNRYIFVTRSNMFNVVDKINREYKSYLQFPFPAFYIVYSNSFDYSYTHIDSKQMYIILLSNDKATVVVLQNS